MPDILAIVSKALFERDAKHLGLGDTLPLDRYVSSHAAFEPLARGGRLVLVTVRPPDEQLWLVAVLENLSHQSGAWVAAAPNRVPLTDVSSLRPRIRFESGKGISQDKGALGMSLQTPRALSAADLALILSAIGPAPARPNVSPEALALLDALDKSPKDEALRERAARRLLAEGAFDEAMRVLDPLAHLAAHDASGSDLPCLCRACLGGAPSETTLGPVAFTRDLVVKQGRVLFYWAPRELSAEPSALRNSVRGSLQARLAHLARSRKKQPRTAF